jgi:hypothetical protein
VTRTPSGWSRSSDRRFDGSCEPVQEICEALDQYEKDAEIDVPCTSTAPRARSWRRLPTRI